MMTELVLVEGVSDVQLISYYLQNVYGWKHERENILGIEPLDEHEHIESLSKDGNQVVLCGVGGNGKFVYFVDGETLFGPVHRDACTVDGCHPNDLGFYRMFENLLPAVKAALNIE